MLVAGLPIEVKVEARAGGELDRASSKGPEPQFWSLQVSEDADWSPRRSLYPPDRRKPCVVVVVCTMAEIEPEDVDARLE
jgi:hypothetical protein